MRRGIFLLLMALAAMTIMLVACGGGLSETDVETRAKVLADEMAAGSAATMDAQVEERAQALAKEMMAGLCAGGQAPGGQGPRRGDLRHS